MIKMPLKGLYAVTQTDNKSSQQIYDEIHAVLDGGAVIVQYRNKQPITKKQEIERVNKLLTLCHRYNAPLIINDNIDLAKETGADGVHLGIQDDSLEVAKHVLGEHSIIGLSCYNSLENALIAQQNRATYVAFGRFFPSSSKPLAHPAEIEMLKIAKKQLTIPIVAIGGILPCNGAELLNAGADLLAVIGALFNENNPKNTAREFCALWNNVGKNV